MASEIEKQLPGWIKLNHTEKGLSGASSGWLSFVVSGSHHAVQGKDRKLVIRSLLENVTGHRCEEINTSNRSSKAKRRVSSVSNKYLVVYTKFGVNCESVFQKVKQL